MRPIAIVQDASKISKRLKHDPSGVRSQKGKWLIDSELGGYNMALVDAW